MKTVLPEDDPAPKDVAPASDSAAAEPPSDRTQIAPVVEPPPSASAPPEPTMIAGPNQPPPMPTGRVVAPGVLINNNYRILGLVSAGGMGEVYRGENVFTGDPVAIKIILPNLARDQAVIDLFLREARILVQLRDDAIVRYHNFVLDSGLNRYCLVMEFVEGRHLWDRINADGPLPVTQTLALLRRLAGGLLRAHQQGITHRDLSPDNVILRDERIDEAVLIDFGIARSTELGDGLNGRFAGKFKYVSPEQLGHAGGQIGPPADVYGLALMIAAVARGAPLDMGDSPATAAMARHAIPDLTGLPHQLYPLLQHMLEPDPRERPQGMDAVLRILDDPAHLPARYRMPLWHGASVAAASDGTDHSGTTGSFTPTGPGGSTDTASASPFSAAVLPAVTDVAVAKAPSRRRPLALALAVATLTMVAGGAWYIGQRSGGAPVPVAVPMATAPQPVAQVDVAALPARDESGRDGFLAAQPVPPCTFAARIANGPDAGRIAILADGPRETTALQDAYESRFAARPAIVAQQIAAAQCPGVDLLAALSGRGADPVLLSLDNPVIAPDGAVSGRIRSLNGRSLWLFLISPQGGVHDLSPTVAAQADGSFTFAFNISAPEGGAPTAPQMIVALASPTPLINPAAAAAGTAAASLLPLVLTEITRSEKIPAADYAMLLGQMTGEK